MGKAEARGVVTAGWSEEAGKSGGRDGGRWAKKNLSGVSPFVTSATETRFPSLQKAESGQKEDFQMEGNDSFLKTLRLMSA